MPATTSCVPFSVTAPKRGMPPCFTVATSPTRIGTPPGALIATVAISPASVRRPTPRTV